MVLHPIYEISFSQMAVGSQQIELSALPASTTFDSVIIKLYIQGKSSTNQFFSGCLTSYAFVGASPSYNLSVVSNNYESYFDSTPNLLGDVINISQTNFQAQLEFSIEGTIATDIKLHYSYMFM